MAHSPHLAMRRSGTQAPQASSLDILKPRPAKAIWFCEMRIADAHAPKPSGAAPAADSFPLGRQLNGMMLLETHLARLRKGDRAAPALSGTPGASGIDVPAGPVAATTAVAVIGLTAVATVKKRRSRPGKQKPVASDRGAAGAVELPSDALPCPNGADDGMMATDAPREAPNPVKKPKKKKAKLAVAEGGGATGVPLPPSAALGMPDVTLVPAQAPTLRTARSGAQRTEPKPWPAAYFYRVSCAPNATDVGV